MGLSIAMNQSPKSKNKSSSKVIPFRKYVYVPIDTEDEHKAKKIINEVHPALAQSIAEAEINAKDEEELSEAIDDGISRIKKTVSSKIAYETSKYRHDNDGISYSEDEITRLSSELEDVREKLSNIIASLRNKTLEQSNWIFVFWGIYVAVTLAMSWVSTARLEDFGFRNIESVNRIMLWLVFGVLSVGFGFATWYLVIRNYVHKYRKDIRIAYLLLIPVAATALLFFMATLSFQILDGHYEELTRLKKQEQAQIENNLSIDEETPASITTLDREIKDLGYSRINCRLFGTLFLYFFEIAALLCFCNLLKIVSVKEPETELLLNERTNLERREAELKDNLEDEELKKKFCNAIDDQCETFKNVVLELFDDRADSIDKPVILKRS